jgi:hypothetical protein
VTMTHAYSQPIIDVAVFAQRGGWVFIGVNHNNGFYNNVLFSGKRKTLSLAMYAARQFAGEHAQLVYCI